MIKSSLGCQRCVSASDRRRSAPRRGPTLTADWSDRSEAAVVVAMVIYFQVALTSFSVLGLTGVFMYADYVTRHSANTEAHMYKGAAGARSTYNNRSKRKR